MAKCELKTCENERVLKTKALVPFTMTKTITEWPNLRWQSVSLINLRMGGTLPLRGIRLFIDSISATW